MGKGKKKKWAELETFPSVIQPELGEVLNNDYRLKGRWRSDFFRNSNPLVLELGCGKGEYTIGLAQMFSGKNIIGVDIKGSRIWRGAKTAFENQLNNVGFIRTRIEFITSFFDTDEVDEIWLTFPDPQLKRSRYKKRLTGTLFLNAYKTFLRKGASIHLKTDNLELHRFTCDVLAFNNIIPEFATEDLYSCELNNEALKIQTSYEKQFLDQGQRITYLKFQLPPEDPVKELPNNVGHGV